jgi:circadian clock protein KaiC
MSHSPKSPSGIRGLDEITGGGLPRGRPTLVAGAAGSGKTLLSMEFLVRGALEHGEPGVFMAFESSGEHNRGLFILKSRGMAHSNQIREFLLTDRGITLLDVPVSSGEVLMGSARVAMEAREREEERRRREEADRKKRLFELKRREKASKVASIETGFLAEAEEFKEYLRTETNRQVAARKTRSAIGRARKADPVRAGGNAKKPAIPRGRE